MSYPQWGRFGCSRLVGAKVGVTVLVRSKVINDLWIRGGPRGLQNRRKSTT
jgi:hypothetical protein